MRIQDTYRLTSYGDLLQKIHSPDLSRLSDFTDNGRCRDCGNCCGNILPLTSEDYARIKSYISKHKIAPARPRIMQGPFAKPTVHNLCPFLMERDDHRCAIYPVRPGICRVWNCHNPEDNQAIKKWYLANRPVESADMYMMFYPERTIKELKEVL